MKVIRGQGMPSQQHHEPGNLYVKFNVKERIIPPRKLIEKFDKDVILEEVTLDDVDTRSSRVAIQAERQVQHTT